MNKLFIILITILLPHYLIAQNDNKAKEVLGKVIMLLSQNGGVQIDFEGTDSGTLVMKGEKFYLHSGNIQSWYDGKTQWSYVAETEEVNISNPTQEDLQYVNPYFILINYQDNFNYKYNGYKPIKGKHIHEIVLTPKDNENSDKIVLWVSSSNQPIYIKVEQNKKTISEVNVKSLQKQQNINEQVFRFNKNLYPNAEIIDLR